jgi:hypothetical protein
MKKHSIGTIVMILVLFLILNAGLARAQGEGPQSGAQNAAGVQENVGTSFTYQGQLTLNGSPMNGNCDMTFSLYDSLDGSGQVGTTLTQAVTVNGGLFTASLDFGANAFTGQARWLAIAVRCPAGSGDYTTLTPRQQLTPAPVALSLPGLYTQENGTSPNIIGGYSGNIISAGVVGATISGGGDMYDENSVTGSYGTVGGGEYNTANSYATVGGGDSNTAAGMATVGGGIANTASGSWATVGGGIFNIASGSWATVPGGKDNTARWRVRVGRFDGGGFHFDRRLPIHHPRRGWCGDRHQQPFRTVAGQ